MPFPQRQLRVMNGYSLTGVVILSNTETSVSTDSSVVFRVDARNTQGWNSYHPTEEFKKGPESPISNVQTLHSAMEMRNWQEHIMINTKKDSCLALGTNWNGEWYWVVVLPKFRVCVICKQCFKVLFLKLRSLPSWSQGNILVYCAKKTRAVTTYTNNVRMEIGKTRNCVWSTWRINIEHLCTNLNYILKQNCSYCLLWILFLRFRLHVLWYYRLNPQFHRLKASTPLLSGVPEQ